MNAGLTIETGSRAKWREAVAHRELPIFFLLAFLLSWYPWFLALAQGRTSGPNPLGPFVAALIVTGIATGWPGIRDLLARIVRGRIGLRWYAVIFGLPVVLCAFALAIMAAFGQVASAPTATAWRELPERFIFIFLFIGLGEEPGWRGFALPRLQKNYSPWMASLILAPIWALWHLPLMGNEFPLPIIPAFLIALLAGTLIQTWLFNRTKGQRLRPDAFSRDGKYGRRRPDFPPLQRPRLRGVLVPLRAPLADFRGHRFRGKDRPLQDRICGAIRDLSSPGDPAIIAILIP